ncbi:MAG: M13 family metallopeptidase [Gammaproteobacteria bacterium]|nr:M13 family metallopeptidase [Gammaproteobacteria bacterium]MDE2251046.1 M13 family metallopeptidase [Gammaproteobacteria bacterium]
MKPIVLVLAFIATGPGTMRAVHAEEPAAAAPSGDVAALHLEWMDRSIDPLQDFYRYANGGFLAANPIPPAYSAWGSAQMLDQRNQDRIHTLLQAAAANAVAVRGSEAQKIGDFYASGMDEAAIEKAGLAPLRDEFRHIAALRRGSDLTAELVRLQRIGVDAAFGIDQMQDYEDSTRVIAVVGQGGLGLPDRDYYLKDDPKYAAIRKAYEQHIARMLALLGDAPAKAAHAAGGIMALETRLAAASMPVEEQRDPHAVYNMRELAALAREAPAIDWRGYLRASGLPQVTRLNLAMPKFFAALSHEMRTTPIGVWRDYLRWQLVHGYAPYLADAYVQENFRLTQAVRGTQELLPRWRRVLRAEDGALGFAVGHEYVKRWFPPEARAQVLEILHGVRTALRDDLKSLPWMSAPTRARAQEKLALMEERIGYPDVWRDYGRLLIDRGPYVLNVMRAIVFENARELAKIGKPPERSEWAMVPQMVNAYYNRSMNTINFPAGILQPPYFDAAAPAAFNYGAIGSIIGHEITHGFDDRGSQFDGHGNLQNWWGREDDEKFQAGVNCIADQFSGYSVDGDLHLKGRLVTGEAIADLGGLLLALRAYVASPAYAAAQDIDGFTPEQQFFLGFAHAWGENVRPEQARLWAAADPHPPAKDRVNGTLANVAQFAEAFGGTPAAGRCSIW